MTREDAKTLISKMQATPISSGDVGDSLRILCNLEGGGMHFTQEIATPLEQAPYEAEPTPIDQTIPVAERP